MNQCANKDLGQEMFSFYEDWCIPALQESLSSPSSNIFSHEDYAVIGKNSSSEDYEIPLVMEMFHPDLDSCTEGTNGTLLTQYFVDTRTSVSRIVVVKHSF